MDGLQVLACPRYEQLQMPNSHAWRNSHFKISGGRLFPKVDIVVDAVVVPFARRAGRAKEPRLRKFLQRLDADKRTSEVRVQTR